jgi:parvulin-like peptidyl-prolyl isomerase
VIRRRSVVAALATVAVAGCGTFDSNDAAATVGDTEVSQDEYEDLLQAFAAHPELTGLQEDPATGAVPGAEGRQWLTLLVLDAANSQFLSAAGGSITDADRQELLDTIDPEDPVFELPDDVVNLLVDQQAGARARGRVAAADDLQARYDASPADLGVLCVRHVLVRTEEEAEALLEELEGGADFAELAAERSLDPNAAQSGGELQPGLPCVSLADAEAALDVAFVNGATAAVPGTPTAPVQSSSGWHIILAHPYDEVADSVAAAVGDAMFAEYLESADITVDPRLGRWDNATRTVVALQ